MLYVALVASLLLSLGAVVVFLGYRRGWRWTGVASDAGDAFSSRPPAPAKTLWDWLQLLVVPLVLAGAALFFNAAQANRQQAIEDRRAERERQRATKSERAANERAADGAREQTLRDYLEQMSQLMLEYSLGPSNKSPETDSRTITVARTLTLTALRQLDGRRKGLVIRFLVEARLITGRQRTTVYPAASGRPQRVDFRTLRGPVISLEGADLRGLAMNEVPEFSSTGRQEAGVKYSDDWVIDLGNADLRGADFRAVHARLRLGRSDLRGADFTGAFLIASDLSYTCLSGARLTRAVLRGSADTRAADLSFAVGRGVDLSGADLDGVDLTHARLTDVVLQDATVQLPENWSHSGVRVLPGEAPPDCSGRG
jgi:uncharacterized protein YjbI with pentapeptide repeats